MLGSMLALSDVTLIPLSFTARAKLLFGVKEVVPTILLSRPYCAKFVLLTYDAC